MLNIAILVPICDLVLLNHDGELMLNIEIIKKVLEISQKFLGIAQVDLFVIIQSTRTRDNLERLAVDGLSLFAYESLGTIDKFLTKNLKQPLLPNRMHYSNDLQLLTTNSVFSPNEHTHKIWHTYRNKLLLTQFSEAPSDETLASYQIQHLRMLNFYTRDSDVANINSLLTGILESYTPSEKGSIVIATCYYPTLLDSESLGYLKKIHLNHSILQAMTKLSATALAMDFPVRLISIGVDFATRYSGLSRSIQHTMSLGSNDSVDSVAKHLIQQEISKSSELRMEFHADFSALNHAKPNDIWVIIGQTAPFHLPKIRNQVFYLTVNTDVFNDQQEMEYLSILQSPKPSVQQLGVFARPKVKSTKRAEPEVEVDNVVIDMDV